MPEEATNHDPSPVSDIPTIDLTLLDDPEFRDGFTAGIDAYLGEVEERDRILITSEVCCYIRHELHPSVRENSRATCAIHGWAPPYPYTTGFLTGWMAAHTKALDATTM